MARLLRDPPPNFWTGALSALNPRSKVDALLSKILALVPALRRVRVACWEVRGKGARLMAFDTPENRFRYERALDMHSVLIMTAGKDGDSYRRGYEGHKWREMVDDFEHWCAGRTNAQKHKSKEQG